MNVKLHLLPSYLNQANASPEVQFMLCKGNGKTHPIENTSRPFTCRDYITDELVAQTYPKIIGYEKYGWVIGKQPELFKNNKILVLLHKHAHNNIEKLRPALQKMHNTVTGKTAKVTVTVLDTPQQYLAELATQKGTCIRSGLKGPPENYTKLLVVSIPTMYKKHPLLMHLYTLQIRAALVDPELCKNIYIRYAQKNHRAYINNKVKVKKRYINNIQLLVAATHTAGGIVSAANLTYNTLPWEVPELDDKEKPHANVL